MTVHQSRWSLSAKLALVGAPFLLLALISTVATLWISWQLDGGAAAVNEAGSMRMQAYRMALTVSSAGPEGAQELPAHIQKFEASLALLRHGDLQRPLQVPWDRDVLPHFAAVERDWAQFHSQWLSRAPTSLERLNSDMVAFVAGIDTFVNSIEYHMSGWTAMLHLLQMCLLVLALLGAGVLLAAGFLFVLEPVNQLKFAIQKIQAGDFGFRVNPIGNDEFGALAEGFNDMASHLQSLYGNLECKVAEKTVELEEKHERLESLYEVTALVARATSVEDLAQDFSTRLMSIAKADGVALRWLDHGKQRYLMLAANGLPNDWVDDERCLGAGDYFCGLPQSSGRLLVIPVHSLPQSSAKQCAMAGFATIVTVPVQAQERLIGEVNLFYRAEVSPTPAERSLLEALNSHLASALKNLHHNASEREAAVSGERHHLSRELHDSIAQSLAFLKIQVQLMRDALRNQEPVLVQKALEEIDTGVRECYGDVRELLVHFRTRTHAQDIEPALATTLRKFELQTGMRTELEINGQGLPLSGEVRIQVLHIVQEALTNVRKHAQASKVRLIVQQQPIWSFEVCDDGLGFALDDDAVDETHVGLHIMSERAQRIDAKFEVLSAPGKGCTVRLTLDGGHLPAHADADPAIPFFPPPHPTATL